MKRLCIVLISSVGFYAPFAWADVYAKTSPEAPSLTLTLLGILLVAASVVDRKIRRTEHKRSRK